MKNIAILFLRFYHYFLSPFLPRACNFEPTCSAYAHEALSRHGIVKGGWLSVKRILRCHPFSHYQCDPVPEEEKL